MTKDNILSAGAKPLGRRAALKLVGAAAGLSLPAPLISRAHAREVLYINTWGGPWEEAAKAHLFEPFMKDTGIEIRTVSPVSVAKLAAQVKSGAYDFDITSIGDADVIRANEAGLLEDIAKAPLDKSKLWPEAFFQNGLATYSFATLIAYRREKFPNGGPTNWAEFWDVQRFPGTRSLQRHPARVLAIALLADGVSPDKLYPMDLDRAFAKLDQIKPHIRVWWTQGPQSTQLLRDGEVDLIGIWQSAPVRMMKEGLPIEVQWNQAILDVGYWVVAKGTPRAALAWRFMNESVLNPERVARFCEANAYGPANPKAYQYIGPDAAKMMPTSPANRDKIVLQDMEKEGGQMQAANVRFERWVGR